MLDVTVVRFLSVFLAVVEVVSWVLFFGIFIQKRQEVGSVKASKPVGFVLRDAWLFLGSLPLIFFLIGSAVPDWVYGTPLNLSFSSAEFLQVASVPIALSGTVLLLWSGRVLGRYMRVEIEVREKHELVTWGPYSRIRHPAYTGHLTVELAAIFLFLHPILILGFLARVAIAHRRAVMEEQLLASEAGFGQRYREYMLKTGRFLPRPTRTNAPRVL